VIDVRVPDEQEGTKAVVRAWLRQVGDLVFENEPLVELETDKVTQEVPAPAAGVLAEIVLDTDAEAVPGALLARISTEEEALAGSPAKAGRSPSAAAPAHSRARAPDRARYTVIGVAFRIVAGSRPTAAQCSASTASLCRSTSGRSP